MRSSNEICHAKNYDVSAIGCHDCDWPSDRRAPGTGNCHCCGGADRAGGFDVGELEASPATTVAQPSKPAISGIGFLKLRWVVLNDSGRIEGERSFRSGDCTVEPFQQSFYRPLLRSLWRLVLVPQRATPQSHTDPYIERLLLITIKTDAC